MTTRPIMKSALLQEIGEGQLFLGADGQIMREGSYDRDEVAIANRPDRLAQELPLYKMYLARYNGTDICQWMGQDRSCAFQGYGRLMRIIGGPAKPSGEVE